jgi:glycosyltransferase involved in cell wall biosynthesis
MSSIPPSEIPKRLGTIKGFLPCKGLKNTLSVCMIVKNEEANIEKAILSFLPFADEIIVNDTGSTDRTLEILARLPKVKVIHSEWRRDFSYSRNLSLAAATCAWCLWMDADDVVPPEQVANFNKLKRATLDRAFGFQVINTQSGGLPIGARFLQIRMFPNHPRIRFERRIHEQIIYGIAAVGLHVYYVDTIIHHTGYESEDLRKSKSERNLELILTEPDRGKDPVVSCQLGDAFQILGRHDEAIAAYKEIFDIPGAENINTEAYNEAFITIGKSYQLKADYPNAIEWLEKAIARIPTRIDPLFYKAESLYILKKYDDAAPLFEKILTLERSSGSQVSHYDVMRMYSFKFLCDIATIKQNPSLVLQWATQFHEAYPVVVESSIFLGKASLALGDASAAILHLERAVATNPKASRDAWLALMLAYEKIGNTVQMNRVRERMATAFGESPEESKRPLLSVAMIVKNEETHLKACLDSIRGLWDDLVIVDTGSTDRTVEIATQAGARVFHFPWIQDFSAARNRSLEESQGQWILWLDADDVLLPEDLERIKNLVQTAKAKKAYGFLIKNSQDAGLTGAVFNQIRLFPNQPEIRFVGRVHEQVMPSLQALGMPVEFMDIRVVHTGYTDPETVKFKQRRNLELMQDDIERSPGSVNAMKFFAMGNAYLDLGEFDEARHWYSLSMAQAERAGEDKHILQILPVKLAECRGNLGFREEALAMINEYLLRNPTQPNALFLRAQLNEAQGNLDLVAADYSCLIHFQEKPTLMPVDFQQIRIRACKMLGHYWMEKGIRPLAMEILRMGIAVGKGETMAGLKLAGLLFEHEQYKECRASLSFARLLEESAIVLLSLGQVNILLNDVPQALEALRTGAKLFPQDSDILALLADLQADIR